MTSLRELRWPLRSRYSVLRAKSALGQQHEQLAAVMAHARDGIMLFDAEGGLSLWNERAMTATGLPPALFSRSTTLARLAAATAHWPGAPLTATDPAPGQPAIETRLGDKTLEVWRRALPDGGQIVMVNDISRHPELEDVARQARKMEALGQLTSGVAHDFNNHMQIVSANLEMLGARVAEDSWLSERLANALAGVDRAARLTRRLLAFARHQPAEAEAVDAGASLLAMEDMLRRTLGEAVRVRMTIDGGLWPTMADPQLLETALLNLALNARDAMPDGGRLAIEAANARVGADDLPPEAAVTPGDYVTITVSDTGIGMTRAQLARATEPFYTTKATGYGTGLGLPMVHAFAKQSGGALTLDSESGHGATVRLFLPRGFVAALPAPVVAETPERGCGELVLVVEDEETVRAVSSRALRELGYRTAEADSAAAALALLEDGLRPDLLFTDVVMPGHPNVRVMAARARRIVPGLAVAFASGYPESAAPHESQLDPSIVLVSKPWRLHDLGRKLRAALAQAPRAPRPLLRVLLVEDELLIRLATADLVVDMGHTVRQASDGREAMRLLRGHPTDLLIADLGLPDIDGLALVEQACALQPGLRVIVTTGRDAPERGVAQPSGEWLMKPYDSVSLRAAINGATATLAGCAAG